MIPNNICFEGMNFPLEIIKSWYVWFHWAIGLMSRVFANGLADWGSISGCVIPKTKKMVLDAA